MRHLFRPSPGRADARGLSANTLTALAAAALATLYSLSFWDRLLAADIPDGARGWLFLAAA
jgi:lipid A ethanolaminephosphotransferase